MHQYKPGDYVYSLNESDHFKKDVVYRVEEVDEPLIFCNIDGASVSKSSRKEFFRPATEKEITNAKNISKKIIGYKVPCDIPYLTWKKGDIAETMDDFNFIVNYKMGCLPLEVVCMWEPIYEITKYDYELPYRNGTDKIFIKYDNEFIYFDDKKMTVGALDLLISQMQSSFKVEGCDFEMYMDKVSIGCKSDISRDDLCKLRKAMGNVKI